MRFSAARVNTAYTAQIHERIWEVLKWFPHLNHPSKRERPNEGDQEPARPWEFEERKSISVDRNRRESTDNINGEITSSCLKETVMVSCQNKKNKKITCFDECHLMFADWTHLNDPPAQG